MPGCRAEVSLEGRSTLIPPELFHFARSLILGRHQASASFMGARCPARGSTSTRTGTSLHFLADTRDYLLFATRQLHDIATRPAPRPPLSRRHEIGTDTAWQLFAEEDAHVPEYHHLLVAYFRAGQDDVISPAHSPHQPASTTGRIGQGYHWRRRADSFQRTPVAHFVIVPLSARRRAPSNMLLSFIEHYSLLACSPCVGRKPQKEMP